MKLTQLNTTMAVITGAITIFIALATCGAVWQTVQNHTADIIQLKKDTSDTRSKLDEVSSDVKSISTDVKWITREMGRMK